MLTLRCRGCGAEVDPLAGRPWSCPAAVAGDDIDHVLVVPLPEDSAGEVDETVANPFLRYRSRLASHRAALGAGLGDGWYVDTVRRLDDAVARVDGTGFVLTPARPWPALATAVGAGRLVAKDETANVSGSHKARHLMGLALWLEVRRAAGAAADDGPLAIASCGNAALAAATVAAAMGRPIDVFVPTWASGVIVQRLAALGARLHRCERRPGESGDPCVLRFREAVAAGSLPFGCQGPDNGLTIDGGRTIGWELAEQVAEPDRVLVQVGGGALGTSVGDGLRAGGPMPRVDAVQSEGCAPFDRAWRRVVADGLGAAVRHRATTMAPWPDEPRSVASGILDDETYDWAGLASVLVDSGGRSIVADEASVARAHRLVHEHTTVDADATGTAGLAGLLVEPAGPDERVVVVFSGVTRG